MSMKKFNASWSVLILIPMLSVKASAQGPDGLPADIAAAEANLAAAKIQAKQAERKEREDFRKEKARKEAEAKVAALNEEAERLRTHINYSTISGASGGLRVNAQSGGGAAAGIAEGGVSGSHFSIERDSYFNLTERAGSAFVGAGAADAKGQPTRPVASIEAQGRIMMGKTSANVTTPCGSSIMLGGSTQASVDSKHVNRPHGYVGALEIEPGLMCRGSNQVASVGVAGKVGLPVVGLMEIGAALRGRYRGTRVHATGEAGIFQWYGPAIDEHHSVFLQANANLDVALSPSVYAGAEIRARKYLDEAGIPRATDDRSGLDLSAAAHVGALF